jgi:SH3-like domain-containing protein
MKLAFLLIVLVLPVFSVHTLAQAPATPAASSKAYTGTVNANDVYIRCGPSAQSAYPFGMLSSGDVVEVIEESFGWVTVHTSGPSFKNIYGYVLANDKVVLSPDGLSLTVNAETEVRAPNIGADGNPDASFKAIGKVNSGEMLKVIATINGEREKVYKVSIPATCKGYINGNYIRRASASEATKIAQSAPNAAVAKTIPAAKTTAPTVTVIEEKTKNVSETIPATDTAPAEVITQETKTETVITETAVNPSTTQEAKPAVKAVEIVVVPPPSVVKTPQMMAGEKRRQTFKDLEVIWVTVKAEPLASSEVGVLKDRYMILMNDPECEAEIKNVVETRVKQLIVQIEAQQRIRQLKEMRTAMDADTDQVKAIKIALEARSDYTVVGILNASSIYDGKRLPLLYRLVDPAVGQTVAYVTTKNPAQLATMLGTLIGIRGEKRYDEALRVSVIEPTTVDILTTRKSDPVSNKQ